MNNNSESDYDSTDLDIDKITDKVLKLIKPTVKDLEKLQSIEKKIKDEIYSYKIPQIVDVKTGGSFAKGTNLKKDMDIDIFILIDKDTNEHEFEKIALDVGFKCLKRYHPITRYSEHPYVEGFVSLNNNNKEHVKLNVVPCYSVEKGDWKSPADRSQYHTEYMKKMLKSEQKNQIRILKAFLKGIGIYGAELSIAGLSGYVTEVLVLKYGNFKNVIENIAMIKQKGELIAINNITNNKIPEKFQSPIIIIDPIDSNRNLGTAISSESLSRFIFGARAFLKNPSLELFNINRNNDMSNFERILQNVSQLLPYILVLEFKYKKRSSDIIWGQLKKLTRSLVQRLNDKEFVVLKSECYIYNTNSAKLFFLLKFNKLSPFLEKSGPSIFMEKEVFQFLKKNKEKSSVIWIGEDMILYCLKKRESTDAIKFLERSIGSERSNLGIPKGLINDLGNGFKIYKINKNRLKNIDNQRVIHDFLFRDMILFASAN
jgi:tRNA nucleotidyltransferase (CCA-adding enzyme)